MQQSRSQWADTGWEQHRNTNHEEFMQTTTPNLSDSNKQLWAARILSGLPALFLLMDAIGKLIKPAPVVSETTRLGYAESVILPLGVVLLICTLLYVIPRTTILGAILLTGYLGGAVNTHVRLYEGWFKILFPVFFGVLLWGGLYLRDRRLAVLMPLTTKAPAASSKMFWGGWVMGVLPALLLFFSAFMKLSKNPQAVEGFAKYGYPSAAIFAIGIVETLCTVLYLIPRTSVLGAILLTGYMGGALSTHLRAGEPFLIQFLVGVLLWGGLYLRDARLTALMPLNSSAPKSGSAV